MAGLQAGLGFVHKKGFQAGNSHLPRAVSDELASCCNGAGFTPRSDMSQDGSTGTEDSTLHDQARPAGACGRGWHRRKSLGTRLSVLDFLKNTLWLPLFLEDYMKCEPHRNVSQPVPTLGCPPTLPPGTGGFSTAPPPGLLPGRLSVHPSSCPSALAQALLGGGGREAVLHTEDDEGIVTAHGFLSQQLALQQRGRLACGRASLSPPGLTVAVGQPAPTGI